MEATETQNRPRPGLQPIWTGYHNLRGHPRSSFRVRSPSFSSPRSPRSLPSPLHPRASSAQDSVMRKHERAMVDSLDQGAKTVTQGGSRPLSPIVEQTSDSSSRRASAVLLALPTGSQTPPTFLSPSPTTTGPAHPQTPRRQTIVAETRNILLSGLTQPQARNVGASLDRRQSLPALVAPPSTPASTGRRSSVAIREQLEAWGHIYFGDAKSADCFVAAVSLRRTSDASEADEATVNSPKSIYLHSPDPNQVTIRARVKPRATERKPFLLQRKFIMDELRATIPEPSPVSASFRRSSSSSIDTSRRRSSVSVDGQSPTLSSGRRFSSSSVSSMPKSALSPSFHRTLTRGANIVPMRRFRYYLLLSLHPVLTWFSSLRLAC